MQGWGVGTGEESDRCCLQLGDSPVATLSCP